MATNNTIISYPVGLNKQGLRAGNNESMPFILFSPFSTVAQQTEKTSIKGSAAGKIDPNKLLENTRKKNTKNRALTIALYHPQNLATTYATSWADEELGVAGALINNLSAGEARNPTLSGVLSAAKKTGGAVEGAFVRGLLDKGGQLAGTNVIGATEKKLGIFYNPRLAVLFKGLGFREFQFSFTFSPESEEEVKTVIDIMEAFKFYSAPSYSPQVASDSLADSFFQYPSSWNIQQYGADGKTSLFKFKECVNTNITIDYSPQSVWATFQNGFPVQVKMDLTFKETELLLREDYAGTTDKSLRPVNGPADKKIGV